MTIAEAPATVALSPSGIDSALECPFRWYVDRNGGRGGTTRAQEIGTLIHAIAEAFPRGGLDAMLAMLEQKWPAHAQETWLTRREWDEAVKMVERLDAYNRSFAGEVLTEKRLVVTVDGVELRGFVDRIEVASDGSWWVVDFKTGRYVPSKAQAEQSMQLGAYRLMADALGQPVAGARLVYLSTGAKATVREQTDLPEDAAERLARAAQVVAGPDYPATPGAHCATCPLSASCPALVG